jgi:DNA-binding MarR family transcriptional regulator
VLGERSGAPPEVVRSTLTSLADKGLVTSAAESDGRESAVELTDSGAAIADTLLVNVRTRLENLLEGWSPEQYPELSKLLNDLAAEVVPDRTPLTGARAS